MLHKLKICANAMPKLLQNTIIPHLRYFDNADQHINRKSWDRHSCVERAVPIDILRQHRNAFPLYFQFS